MLPGKPRQPRPLREPRREAAAAVPAAEPAPKRRAAQESPGWLQAGLDELDAQNLENRTKKTHFFIKHATVLSKYRSGALGERVFKLTWLVLGGDPAARSHRVEQLAAL